MLSIHYNIYNYERERRLRHRALMKNCASGLLVISAAAAAASVRWGLEVRPLGGRRDPGSSIGQLADNERWHYGWATAAEVCCRAYIYMCVCVL